MTAFRLAPIAAAMLAAGLLAGCGGSGNNVRVPPPPISPPPVAPPPGPPVVEDPNPAYSQHLAVTHADAAHAAGFTGEGVRIGIIDSGVNRDHPALQGRVVSNLTYIDGSRNDLTVDDVVGHGTAVAQAAAGAPFGAWPGGIAPGAEIVSARIINDEAPEDDGSGEGNEVHGALGLAPIHDDLIARGVRIMNNSWGGLYWNDPGATAPIAGEYRRFITDNDGLVVFAAGNSSFADPSDMAALPSQAGPGGSLPAADLERGWLTVVALSEGSANQLADYSNACGIAMHYCLAAPGTVVVTGTDDAPDSPEYWKWSGTSLAAPLVSGTAALVWEAFPYFDNDLVRQTILGTATDIGDTGVDATFGYGQLDAGRAVLGPARFDWGDVTVDFDGIESTWGNPITGDGGLVKRGTGTLVLGESSDYLGDTRVEGGTLRIIDNNTLASDVFIGADGTLAGYGGVGSVHNDGTLQVDDHVFNVHGDYHQSAQGRLAVVLGNEFLVAGTAFIDGELYVLGANDGYTASGRVTVLAANAISGTFAELGAAPSVFLEGTLAYSDTNVFLDITRMDVTAAAMALGRLPASSMASAERVENAFRRIDEQQATGDGVIGDGFIRAAGAFQGITSEAAARRALSSLSGNAHAAAASMTFDSIDLGRRALSSRFADFAGRPDRAGAWTQVLGRGGQGGFIGDDFSVDGWMLGRDRRIGDRAVAGFAFGETRAHDALGDDRERSRDRQTQGRLYAGSLLGDGYLLGQLGTGHFDRNIERQLFTGEDRRPGVSSRYGGDYFTANVEAGYRLRAGGGELVPYLGMEHARLRSDGFLEQGADGFGLQGNGWTSSRTQAIAGFRAGYDWRGLDVHGYAEWQQTLAADGLEAQAGFVGADAWAPLPGLQPARSGGLYGLGVSAWLSRNSVLGLGYDQRFGPRGDARTVSMRYVLGF
ncbi:MAG TPA: S8 family serine peptidase [Luteimonas sp.]|nr:S8 family serine peptidase [Luteimonas sp.]